MREKTVQTPPAPGQAVAQAGQQAAPSHRTRTAPATPSNKSTKRDTKAPAPVPEVITATQLPQVVPEVILTLPLDCVSHSRLMRWLAWQAIRFQIASG